MRLGLRAAASVHDVHRMGELMRRDKDPRGGLNAEIRRLKAALGAIHDALHANAIDRAHELCECAIEGKAVTQPNLGGDAVALSMDFSAKFNALAEGYRLRACCIALFPSATVPNAVSMQMCGEVWACKIVEEQLRGAASVYMGDHG